MHSLGAKQAVAGIAEARYDIFLVVELFVNGGGVDGNIWMELVQIFDSLWGCQQANELDALWVCLF